MNLEMIQAGAYGLQAGMMKGKTMTVAACATACLLSAEIVFVPKAMDSSYERSIESVAAMPDAVVQESTDKNHKQEKSRYIPLTPIKRHQTPQGKADLSPVS